MLLSSDKACNIVGTNQPTLILLIKFGKSALLYRIECFWNTNGKKYTNGKSTQNYTDLLLLKIVN